VGPVVGAAAVALLLVLLTVGGNGPASVVVPSVLAVTALGVAVWAVHRARADRAAYETRLTDWAAAGAVQAERMRVAGDLHDIVSHGLGLITVRAAAARHVTATGGAGSLAEARQALDDIEAAAREATAELRRLLSVLRTASDAAAPRMPVDSLDRLPDIARGANLAGLRTTMTVDAVGDVSQGVQVAVCRAVREALSNAARHAGPTDVRVHVRRDGDEVVVSITDSGPDGTWHAGAGAGHGLLSLRERVNGLGGTLIAEPAGAGFRVLVRIPDPVAP
jgi:two-component system sensor histidine kinase DesK